MTENREGERERQIKKTGWHRYSWVVSIDYFHAFYVIFVPLEYIPSIPPHSTYVIVIRTFSEWVTVELHLEGETMKTKSFVVRRNLYFDYKFTICSFTIILINVDIYGLTCPAQWESRSSYTAGPPTSSKVWNN